MKKGFTLIELLVVILIIGILSSVAMPQYRRSVERTRVAEAQTLLRAIYDAQERLLWSKGYELYSSAIDKGDAFGFEKLDITVKGTYETSPTSGISNGQLKTENFRYDMSNSDRIIATPIKGDYTDASIAFDGETFSCLPATAKACTVWAANTWNQL